MPFNPIQDECQMLSRLGSKTKEQDWQNPSGLNNLQNVFECKCMVVCMCVHAWLECVFMGGVQVSACECMLEHVRVWLLCYGRVCVCS